MGFDQRRCLTLHIAELRDLLFILRDVNCDGLGEHVCAAIVALSSAENPRNCETWPSYNLGGSRKMN